MTGRVAGKVAFITGAARGRAAATRCDWPRRAPTSSPSTSAGPIDTVDRIPAHHRRTSPRPRTWSGFRPADRHHRGRCARLRRTEAAVDSGVEQLGGLDIIVANAGIGSGGNTLDKTSGLTGPR